MRKTCSKCETEKDAGEFYKGRICKVCHVKATTAYANANRERTNKYAREYYSRNKDYYRRVRLAQKYNMTIEDFDFMLIEQGWLCECCGDDLHETTPVVDHDHETGKVRAILCGNCNRGLGQFKDDIERLWKAVRYLEQH